MKRAKRKKPIHLVLSNFAAWRLYYLIIGQGRHAPPSAHRLKDELHAKLNGLKWSKKIH